MKPLLSIVVIAAHCFANLTAAEKPNIIVIFTDDHGYSDLSCQGVYDDVKTPHIDAIMQRFGDLQTVGERLQSAGYATGMAGKWHLGESNKNGVWEKSEIDE